ncbi:MAG: 4Fe-4S binding protein [Deltaproteobacteria bacterium]|nr:4Fe-4S binding protein [Deltaproteobacteria bacterium]
MAHWIKSNCNKCGMCLSECPTGAIIEGKTQYYIDADTCADHRACVAVCPVDAVFRLENILYTKLKKKDEEEEEET